ncbi:MAG: hypothetical protein ACD_7C00063G0010 [uncultured bacterium]|nr:MAG: hypothetical protein ACD_7C00063G0010 [uncultured bacterium]HBR79074.1 hypothetical protein [Candidatus Moranbacteria bacterium]
MKTKIWLMAVLLLLAGLWDNVKAETVYSIEVTWAFSAPSDKTVFGYRLFKAGEPAITWEGGDISVGTVILALPENTQTSFTLAAIYADGTQSPLSPTYLFKPGSAVNPSITEMNLIASMMGKLMTPETKIKKGILMGG